MTLPIRNKDTFNRSLQDNDQLEREAINLNSKGTLCKNANRNKKAE